MSSFLPSRYLPESPDPYAFDEHPPQADPGPVGILLINLGTPDEPTPASIRRYLGEFLSDPRVIEIPQVAWQVILRLFILPLRPKKLAPRYQGIWLENGSPLMVYSAAQAQGLQQNLSAQGMRVRVELAMRYGTPSVPSAIKALREQGCERILTVPLYPQYAASTTATAVDAVTSYAARLRNQPELRFIKRYNTDPGYIQALARTVTDYWQTHGKPQRLLLSFHGLPRRTIQQGDPYHRDCMETADALRACLANEQVPVYVSFQSRFGAERWLEPYTEPLLQQWGKEGIADVDVICPGFLADCLETLEEIKEECCEAFLHAGGKQFRYIPCLNDNQEWINALTALVRRHLGGWL
jgi:ferrochelatase